MTRLKKTGDLFSVKVKKDKKGSNNKKKLLKKRSNKGDNGENKKKQKDSLSGVDIQPLTYESLTAGQVLLGCVVVVKDYELIISLPHKLVGTVSLAQVSKPYTALLSKLKEDEEEGEEIHTLQELFKVGQHVVTSIISVDDFKGRTKVNLTLMPNEVNFGIPASLLKAGLVLPCAVASVEDNGYVMDTGIQNVRGAFLKREDAEGSGLVGVGSVIRCVISKVLGSDAGETNLRLVLKADAKAVSSATLDLRDTSDLALLLPGTAVNTTVSKVRRDGLNLVMANSDGVVSPLHLTSPYDRLKQYEMGKQVRAKVLYITPLTKVVHFTLQKAICSGRQITDPLQGFKIGDIIQDAEIYQSAPSGVYLKLKGRCRGFCSGNRLTDKDKIPKHITRDFPVGGKATCRLIKYDYMDQLFIVSLQKSVLEQQIVAYSEIEPGQILKATVKGYNANGAEVAVSKFVDGHIPFLHLTDTQMKHPERKHSTGDVVRARVLKVNADRRHLLLTCKTQLVEAKEPIVMAYNRELENTVTQGCIVKIMEAGMLIGLFNDVKGFVPKSQVTTEPVDSLDKLFKVGQVVKCRILKVFPEKSSITLSLIIDGTQPFGKKKISKVREEVAVRGRVQCVVQKVLPHALQVTISPNNIKAEIPVHHFSDSADKSRLLQGLIKEGAEIENAVVFRKDASTITLSLKSSVSQWVESGSPEALNSSELLEHESYPAVVTEVRKYGIIVLIPIGRTGHKSLVHVKNLTDSDTRVDINDLGISEGQTVYVSFKDRDKQGRPNLTSSLKVNLQNVTQSSVQLLHSYFKDEERIRKGFLNCGGKGSRLAKFEVGDKVTAVVTAVTPLGVLVREEQTGITGVVGSNHQDSPAALKVGQKMECCVLHVNQEEKCLELASRQDLIKTLHIEGSADLKVGMKVKCEIILVKKHFLMVMMKSRFQGRVAYLPSLRHLNDFSGRSSSLYAMGEEYRVVVKQVAGPLVLGVLKQHDGKGEDLATPLHMPEVIFKPSEMPAENSSEDDREQEPALDKIQRVRMLTQGSVESADSVTEGKDKLKGKQKRIDAGDDPRKDEETLLSVTKRRRLERKKLKELKLKKEEDNLKEGEGEEEPEKQAEGFKKHQEALKRTAVDDPPQSDSGTLLSAAKRRKLERKRKKSLNEDLASVEMNEPKQPGSNIGASQESRTTLQILQSIRENVGKQQHSEASKEVRVDKEEVEVSDSGVEVEEAEETKPAESKPCLTLGTGFVWDIPETTEDQGPKDSSDSEEEEEEEEPHKKKAKKLKRSERVALAKEEERRLHQLELSRLDEGRAPQSALDYEAMLQHSPNSSAVWIQFISFHLESAEVDKAKAVARRALQVIDIREEEERLNVWTVLLRLEVLYGTAESVGVAYKEALTTNDALKVHLAMAMVYAENNKLKEAEKVYFNVTKKFGTESGVWLKAGIFFFSNNMAEEARRYLERALRSLHKKDHVDLINRFGQLEFRFGEAERGRTMFESLLSNYPKRIDIWSVYVDLLAKRDDIEGARHVLERMTGLKLRIKKMRFVFKKFLEFEKEHGTTQNVEAVKRKVEEFVAATLHDT